MAKLIHRKELSVTITAVFLLRGHVIKEFRVHPQISNTSRFVAEGRPTENTTPMSVTQTTMCGKDMCFISEVGQIMGVRAAFTGASEMDEQQMRRERIFGPHRSKRGLNANVCVPTPATYPEDEHHEW